MTRKNLSLFLSIILTFTLILSSCSKKISPLSESLFTATPSPLELVGSKVPVTINGRFPSTWMDKNITVVITPVLKFGGQEVLGTSQTYQGENVSGNGIVINKAKGGPITLSSSFDYTPAMKKSELYLRFKVAKEGKKVTEIPDMKLADGIVSTAALASAYTTKPALVPDGFQRIIQQEYDADIMFLIQQAELRASELNSSDLAIWKEIVQNASRDNRKKVNVEISAYASPDGGYELNEKLAEKREKNTNEYLSKDFKNKKINTEINAKYTAQDWEGFKKLVQASSLQDKDIVLRVLSMYPDPETREKEIKNISSVYSELAETILPKLRRSRLIANVEIIGKTDDEILGAVDSDISSLSIEELLYAANLEKAPKEKIYEYIIQKYPNDYRAYNNLGATYFKEGKVDQAIEYFNKAFKINPRAPEANMNLGLIALSDGNISKAEQLLGNASGSNTIGEALGLLYLKTGDYNKAVQSFGDTYSNNAALAQILTKNYNKADQILNGMTNKDATSNYLRAIIAARMNNASGVGKYLKAALDQGFYPDDMLNDIEFSKFLSAKGIKNIIN